MGGGIFHALIQHLKKEYKAHFVPVIQFKFIKKNPIQKMDLFIPVTVPCSVISVTLFLNKIYNMTTLLKAVST